MIKNKVLLKSILNNADTKFPNYLLDDDLQKAFVAENKKEKLSMKTEKMAGAHQQYIWKK